jgi:processive 1,2-diacylglycerol beta-glucosyltransferase
MYISDISGHRSAALAVEEAIKTLEPTCQTKGINTFHYTNPVSEKIVNRLYLGIISRTPQVWDYLYDNPRVLKRVSRIKKVIHKLNSPKLKNLFDEFRPDAVVCTQAFPCGMVADYKEIYGSELPLVAVMTDYVPHSYWIYDKVDRYIVPSPEVASSLQAKAVAAEKIFPLGIPIDPRFNLAVDRHKVKEMLGLKEGIPVILIMGGGQGLGPLKTVVRSLDKLKREFQGIVVCGSNQRLYDSLSQEAKRFRKHFLVLGYADNIPALMSIAEMIITKPGGITTAEALSKALPMIIVSPLPGQEVSNTDYLIERQAAVKLERAEGIAGVVEGFLREPDKLKSLREAAARISKPHASLDIARLVLSLTDV